MIEKTVQLFYVNRYVSFVCLYFKSETDLQSGLTQPSPGSEPPGTQCSGCRHNQLYLGSSNLNTLTGRGCHLLGWRDYVKRKTRMFTDSPLAPPLSQLTRYVKYYVHMVHFDWSANAGEMIVSSSTLSTASIWGWRVPSSGQNVSTRHQEHFHPH